MIVAIHQPNFCAWMPFFEKMAKCDIFVILTKVQFEKNGWQNRCQVNGKWWTNPVKSGLEPIENKSYTDGNNLLETNMYWIYAIAKTLGIDTNKIKYDFDTDKKGTARIIEICQHYHATEYLTNPEAFDKYLELKPFEQANIKIIPFHAKHKKHVFELFDEIGIQKTKELICNL